jgi:hypothetical protein
MICEDGIVVREQVRNKKTYFYTCETNVMGLVAGGPHGPSARSFAHVLKN